MYKYIKYSKRNIKRNNINKIVKYLQLPLTLVLN